jgi:hypothetical protein
MLAKLVIPISALITLNTPRWAANPALALLDASEHLVGVGHPYLVLFMQGATAVALLLAAAAFLFLAFRVSWAVQQIVGSFRARQKSEDRLVETVRDYVEFQRGTTEQLWSASAALSAC